MHAEYASEDSPEPVRIRTATEADAPAIAAIYAQHLGTASMDLTPRPPSAFAELVEAVRSGARECLLVSERAGEVLGWGAVRRYSDREGYRIACETSVFLDGAHLHRGHGSRMKRVLLERARALGYRHVVAKIVARNQASIRYNEKAGFEVVGVQKGIGLVNGERVDVCIMQCLLEPEG